jgi:hypothetical protein
LNQEPRGHVKRFVDASRRAPTNTEDEQVPLKVFPDVLGKTLFRLVEHQS